MPSLTTAALFFPLFFAIVALCACVQRRRARRQGQWFYLTPGPFYWLGLSSGVLVSAVATLVVAAGRGGGPGAFLFAGFFVAATIALALHGILEEVRWDRNWLERRTVLLQRRRMSWHELARAGVEWSGYHWVCAFDGAKLRYSPYDNGCEQLLNKIRYHLPRDRPPAEPAETAEFGLELANVRARLRR